MDLKFAFVTVLLLALAITSAEAGIPKCCIKTKDFIPQRVLRKVYRTEDQTNSGACDINALVLYVRGIRKPVCAPPKLKILLQNQQQRLKQKQRPQSS